jgi:hypothetical protein
MSGTITFLLLMLLRRLTFANRWVIGAPYKDWQRWHLTIAAYEVFGHFSGRIIRLLILKGSLGFKLLFS